MVRARALTTKIAIAIPNSLVSRNPRTFRSLVLPLVMSVIAVLAPFIATAAHADDTGTATTPVLSPAGAGPAGHILGLDISRYQHTPNSNPAKSNAINFAQMYNAGVRFLYINGGNSIDKADQLAAGYYAKDHAAAQAAGLLTGFYYYAHMPNTRESSIVVRNAHNQALKVINRIQGQGGLTAQDMPIALDLETSCIRQTVFGICLRKMSKTLVTEWTTTWLSDIKAATGRTPIIYSYLSFLTTEVGNNSTIAQSPLWISTAGINPATTGATPATKKRKGGKCYTSAWMDSSCNLHWTMWQYSSGGSGKNYGLAGGKVDLDIFVGDDAALTAFAAGQ